jgi:histidinol-phosphate aminotransferase
MPAAPSAGSASRELRRAVPVSNGPEALVREEIRALKPYHVPPAAGMVKLDAMENPYRLPTELAARMGERLAAVAVNRYPDPEASGLKARLRTAMGIPAHLDIVLGNGSDELIQVISLALARPGAVAVGAEPSFVMYRMSAIAAGLRYEGVSLAGDFSLDERSLRGAFDIHRPALTWIAYPNNPTGNLFPREAILRLVAAAPGLVVVDEAYYAFAGGASFMDEIGRHPNLVLLRTVSKLGLAGLRLGLAIGAPAWMSELEKLRPPYNVNVLTMAAAELLLAEEQVFAAQTAAIVAERGRLEAALDALPGVLRFPSAANFVLVRVADAPAVHEALKARGILIKTLHGTHPLLANCLRLTVGTPDENAKLLGALASILGPQNA